MMTPSRKRAFTLVELMLAMSIIIVVTAIMIPTVSTLTGGSRIEGAVNQVQGFIRMAQQQAFTYNKKVRVRFLPPFYRGSPISPNTRLVLYEQKLSGQGWKVLAGSRAAQLPTDLVMTNEHGRDDFYITFNSRGAVEDGDTVMRIGVRSGSERRDHPKPLVINRSTGAFLRF